MLWKYTCIIDTLQPRNYSRQFMASFQQIMTSVQVVGFPMERLIWKYNATSGRVVYMLRAVCTRAQIQGLRESRLAIRVVEDQGLVSCEKVRRGHRVQCSMKVFLQRWKRTEPRPIVVSILPGHSPDVEAV